VVLSGHSDLDIERFHHLGLKLRGKARVLIEDNAKGKTMYIEDGCLECFKHYFGGGVLEGDEVCIGGKAIHDDYD
jgi:hypothetical protein